MTFWLELGVLKYLSEKCSFLVNSHSISLLALRKSKVHKVTIFEITLTKNRTASEINYPHKVSKTKQYKMWVTGIANIPADYKNLNVIIGPIQAINKLLFWQTFAMTFNFIKWLFYSSVRQPSIYNCSWTHINGCVQSIDNVYTWKTLV